MHSVALCTMGDKIALTQYSKGAGCGCKIAPAVLDEILHTTQQGIIDPRIIIGNATRDDAAVFDLGDGRALISTTDFFTPILDDPFDFGAVAAANALSDVYAMGGAPLMAIAILGWPVEVLPAAVARQVLEGARHTCHQAGVVIAGGHSIENPEPFFGLSVSGSAPLNHIKANRGAQAGDVLLLTKPLGTGLISTALKRGKADHAHVAAATTSMKALNQVGSHLGGLAAVRALTDVTGFGLAGHLIEMCGDALDVTLHAAALPTLPGVDGYIEQDCYSDGLMRNFKSYGQQIAPRSKREMYLLCDPQTNGGLLVVVPAAQAAEVAAYIHTQGQSCYAIGHFAAGNGRVQVQD